eukprot:3134293-Rhodomonas_salina.1
MLTVTDERARGRYVWIGKSGEENERDFERKTTGGERGREGDAGSETEEGAWKEEARRSESKSS